MPEPANHTTGDVESLETTDAAPDFSRFKEAKTWEFDVDGVTFRGSEPTGEDADDEVARLISPSENAGLLYYRALTILHDAPTIPPEEWQEFTARNRARIASNHLDEFGIDEFYDPEKLEQVYEEMQAQASEELNQ